MILPIPLLAAIFLSLAPFVSCQAPASDKTLMQALADIPECKKYYEFLQQHPEAQSPPSGQDYVVFCPSNEAVDSKLAAPRGGKIKRDDYDASQTLAMQTATGVKVTKGLPTTPRTSAAPNPGANPNPTAPAQRKRQVASVFTSLATVVNSSPTATGAAGASVGGSPRGSVATSTPVATSFTSGPDPVALDPNQLTLKTLLTNPAFVNLGPGEPARMVSFASPPTNVTSNLKLSGGLGDIISVIRGDIPFNLGKINVVDK